MLNFSNHERPRDPLAGRLDAVNLVLRALESTAGGDDSKLAEIGGLRKKLGKSIAASPLDPREESILRQVAQLPEGLRASQNSELTESLRSLAVSRGRQTGFHSDFLDVAKTALSAGTCESITLLYRVAANLFRPTLLDGNLKLAHAFVCMAKRCAEKGDYNIATRTADLLELAIGIKPLPNMVENFIRVHSTDQSLTAHESAKMMRELLAHGAINETIWSSNPYSILGFSLVTNGHRMGLWWGPFRTAEGLELHAQYDQLFDIFEGFQGDTFPSRRRPLKGAISPNQKFSQDIGAETSVIFQKNRDGYPGPGIVIQNPDPRKAFQSFYLPNARDPLKVYKEMWASVAGKLDHLARSRIILTRSFIAVTGPDTAGYRLTYNGDSGQAIPPEHYSLVVFNGNHGNSRNDVAMLVATRILDANLESSAVKVHPSTEIPEPLVDFNTTRLTPADLRSQSAEAGVPCLDVGSPLLATGRYEGAYQKYSQSAAWTNPPIRAKVRLLFYFAQEVQLPPVSQDLNNLIGDSHSAHALEIKSATESSLALLKALRLVRGRWSKGLTASIDRDGLSFTQADLDQALEKAGLNPWWSVDCAKTLRAMYDWSEMRSPKHGFAHRDDPNHFPVLVPANSFRYSDGVPADSILIDSFSGVQGAPGMTIRKRDGTVANLNSPSRGRSLQDTVDFVRDVLQHCASDEFELRMMDRRAVNWSSL